jgi:hypothetical protein
MPQLSGVRQHFCHSAYTVQSDYTSQQDSCGTYIQSALVIHRTTPLMTAFTGIYPARPEMYLLRYM